MISKISQNLSNSTKKMNQKQLILDLVLLFLVNNNSACTLGHSSENKSLSVKNLRKLKDLIFSGF
jgi:hypothetical protein